MMALQNLKFGKTHTLLCLAFLGIALLLPGQSNAQIMRLANIIELSEKVSISGNELHVSYLLQCGETYNGTIFARGKETHHWFIGVLISTENFRCTSAAKLALVKHPINLPTALNKRKLNSPKMQYLPILETSKNQHLSLLRAKQVRIKNDSNITTAPRYIAYDSACGDFVGVLINQQREDRRFYGVLEGFNKKNNSQSSCGKKPSKTYLPREFVSNDFWQNAKLRSPLKNEGQDDLTYRLAPIRFKKIEYNNPSATQKTALIQVPYFRTCRQAPLGLVVQDKGNNSFAIGVLLAEKSRQKCRQGRKFEWQTLKSSIQLPANAKLISLRNFQNNSGLNIHAPNIGPLGKVDDLRLKVVTDSCQKLLGTLYSEQSKFTSIGIITENDTLCQSNHENNNIKLVAEQSLSYHPPFIKDFIQKDIYPFQM